MKIERAKQDFIPFDIKIESKEDFDFLLSMIDRALAQWTPTQDPYKKLTSFKLLILKTQQ